MEKQNRDDTLARADALASTTSQAARWLARYYVAFGIGSLGLALGLGLLDSRMWRSVLMVAWLFVIIAISAYSRRQKTMVRGGARLHSAVNTTWAVIWGITVAVGSTSGATWPWWLAGGLGMLATSLVGAWLVIRRTGVRV